MGQTIYIADDEKNIRELLQAFLESDGYEVTAFPTGDALLAAFQQKPADLVILDIMMPGKDGLCCCEELRRYSAVPIIMLTARDTELDYVQGIMLGSDDYLMKPFRPTILLMRVKALLRRMDMNGKENAKAEMIQFADLRYLPEQHCVFCGNRQLHLTKLEQRVLTYMLEKPENAYSREEFLQSIWDYADVAAVESRVVDETLRRIRKKLKDAKSQVNIESVWGYGYRLRQEGQHETDTE